MPQQPRDLSCRSALVAVQHVLRGTISVPSYLMQVGLRVPFNVTASSDRGAFLQARDALSFLLSHNTRVLLTGPAGDVLFDATIAEMRCPQV